jgi:uncharacterized protein
VIAALEEIAPVTFVRGNNDDADGMEIVRITLGNLHILLTHILPRPGDSRAAVRASLAKQPADVVVFGHSHLPHNEVIDGARFFNPGSAGPRRFDFAVSVGILEDSRALHIALDARSKSALKKRMNQLSRK